MKKYLCAFVLIHCAASADVSTTETTSAVLRPIRVVATEGAINDITRAECARAEACGGAPSRGVYVDADYCETDVHRAVRDELVTGGCAYVDRGAVAACLDSIRHESCGDLNFTKRAPTACRHAALCR
jgi:hypothetical protein